MPLPDAQVQQQSEALDKIVNPGFETENLPSPKGFDAPTAPIPLPGTGQTVSGTGEVGRRTGLSQSYINQVLGTKDNVTPGKLPTYTASDVYNPRYSSVLPGEDSEEAFAKAQPWYKQWGNALVKMGATAAGTFLNTLTALPDTISSINDGKPYETNIGNSVDSWLKNLENSFPNYYTKQEQEHPFRSFLPFSGGFSNAWGDKFLKNLGFTIGAIGGAAVQNLVVGTLTDGLGEIPGVGAQIGKASLWLHKLFTTEDKVGDLLALGKAAGRSGEQLMNLKTLAQLAAAKKTANGVKFALNLYGASASEAAFEARDGYNNVRQDLITAYQREHGYSPVGKELDEIEKYSRASGNTRFGLNLAILGLSNAIQFDNILKPFSAAKAAWRSSIQKELEEGAGTIGLKEGSMDIFESVVPKTVAGKVWKAVRPSIPAILSEGVYEEGGQYAAQIGTENYYERKYIYDKGLSTDQYKADKTPWNARDQVDSVVHSMIKGMAAEFGTQEGLENIFIGGLTGALTGGVEHFMDREKSTQTRTAVLKMLNDYGVTGNFRSNYDATVHAERISEDMKEAVRNNDLFKYKNFQHEQFVNFVLSGIKAGRFDVRMEQLKLLKEMPDEQFKQAFGLDKTTDNVKTVTEYVDKLMEKAQAVKKSWDMIDSTFNNPYQFNRKAKTPEQSIENEKHHLFEGWKSELVHLASILPDVDSRLYSINKQVKDISQYVNNEQLQNLTNPKSLKDFAASLREQAKVISDGLDKDLSLNKDEDRKKLTSLTKKADRIDAALGDKNYSPAKLAELFEDLLNYHINGQSDDLKVKVPKESVPTLMNLGVDINRLEKYRENANKAFDALSSEEGFDKYFRDAERSQEQQRNTPSPKPEEKQDKKTGKGEEKPIPPKPPIIISHKGQQRIYDQGKDYFIQTEKGQEPQKVKIIRQVDDLVEVSYPDGTTGLIPAENLFADEKFEAEINDNVDQVTTKDDVPPPEEGTGQPATKRGDQKKDISFGLYSTTDPTYDNKTTPFSNFQRRHQNFLFNLGSTNPQVFNQESKPKLRLIPVTAKTAALFGFPADFVQGSEAVDDAVIRAVYAIDDKDGVFFVDGKGNKLSKIGEPTNPNDAIFTTLPSTSLVFGREGAQEERYTNKYNINQQDAQNWWREQRRNLLDIGSVDATPMFQFNVSRGVPNVINYDLRNSVLDVGLIRESDLDLPVITIPTEGNVAVLGAYNNEGQGVGAAKEGINMPLGTPLLNHGGNLIFLNNKTLGQGQAENVFEILKVIGSRSTQVDKAGLFKYLNKVVYLANKKKNVKPTTESITIDGSNLYLGTSNDPIHMSQTSLEQHKGRIIDFLSQVHHATNNSELNRIRNNPKANDLEFRELRVSNGQVSVANTWKNYQHYLLSNHNPDGTRRSETPLTTNISIPQAGEVPIIQKYAVLRGVEFDNTVRQNAAQKPAPVTQTPTAEKTQQKDKQQGVKQESSKEGKNEIAPQPSHERVEIQTKSGPINVVIEHVKRDQSDNITDFRVVGKIDNGKIVPVKDAAAVKNILLDQLGPKQEQKPEVKEQIEKATEQPETTKQEPYSWIEVDLGKGPVKLAFRDVQRDQNGNITDLTPAGRVSGEEIIPFKDSAVVKEIILDELRRNEIKQDNTNAKEEDFWNDDNLKKDSNEPQYRSFSPEYISYKPGELGKEFEQARRMLGDDQLLMKLDHVIRTTGGGLAYGAFENNVIKVWEGGKIGTTHHEVFEKVYNSFLNGKEQQDLYNEFISRPGTFKTFKRENKNFSDATVREAKEQMAEEFTDYLLNNKLPQYKKQRNFFQRLLDFIKKIIFGDKDKINRLFKNINKGYYRNYSSSLNYVDPQYREVELENFSQALIQDALQGMTVEMLMEAFKEGGDIITQLEENEGKAAKDIYSKLKSNLEHYFENTKDSNTLAAMMKAKRDSLTKDDDKEAVKDQYRSIVDEWKRIKDNWDSFVRMHQRYLRVFNVEFEVDDEGNIGIQEDDEADENKNYNEYDRDILKIDAKNSASTKIKLLIATLADSEWVKQATVQAIGATRGGDITIKRDNSLLALPKQVQYAKTFNYLLHNTTGINTIYAIWERMKEMTTDPETRKNIDANIKRLMNRIDFDKGFESKNVNQAKLVLSLESTLSKQKLGFSRQFVDFQRNTFYKTTVLNSKIDQVKSSWIAAIKGSGSVVSSKENTFRFSESVLNSGDNLQFLNRIGIPVTKAEFNRLKGSDITKFNQEVNVIRSLIEKAAENKTLIPIVSSKQLDFDGRLNGLAELYVTKLVGDDTQSQHPNLDNEQTSNFVLNNAASTVLNDANQSATREEFINKIDNQYFNDIFHRDSILVNKVIFDEQTGKFRQKVELEIVEGRESWNQNNKAAYRLTEAERQLYELNNNLNGVFYTLLPADAKMEWAIRTGTYLSAQRFFGDTQTRSAEVDKFANQMYSWLQTEIDLAKDYPNRKNIEILNTKLGDRVRGNSLRFFMDILPKDIVDKIHTEVIDGSKELAEVLSRSEMKTLMRDMAMEKAQRTLDNLLDWRLIDATSDGQSFILRGFDKAFTDEHIDRKQNFSREEVMRLLGFREMNYILNGIEMHKMFFGDPAQYKDELKRIKSFLSGREVSHVDTLQTSEGFNQWANTALNSTEPDGKGIQLTPQDPGYHFHKNHLNTITVYDVDYESNQLEQIQEAVGKDRAKPYAKGNEADAQAWISPTAYRETMWKAGGRFTAAQERQFQWEMAWERQDKAKEGKYTYTNKELEKADKELLKSAADPDVAYQPLKLVHSGIQYEGEVAIASLDKASWAPMFYRWVKGTSLEGLHDSMQSQGIDYTRMESAHKVGIQENSSARLYDSEGNYNKDAISKLGSERISFKQLGVQVEQRKKEKGQTEGSQARKMVTLDLMDQTVPIDFMRLDSADERYEEWNKLSEEQKRQTSPIYSRIKRHDEAIDKLVESRLDNTMHKLGITKGINGEPVITDKQKISDFILSELERRELPRNLAFGLEIDPRTGDFSQPLEANAQYSKIRSILYSVIEDTIMRPKVNGGQKTMVSVTGWEKGKRIVKKTVNGKPIYTTDTLKFYTRGDGRTEACEVMLPYWFGKKLSEMGSGRSKEEVIKHLNETEEGQQLLRGIGFRIPTQGKNSMDFFTVKDFLPEQMGDIIIFPAEITAKAGSDFDIDKANTYMRNWYVDNQTGYPKLVQWKGSEQATKTYLGKLLDEGNVISKEKKDELDRIIAEETADLDPNHPIFKIMPSWLDKFSDVSLTRDFLGNWRASLINQLYTQALENEFFDSIEDLLSLPENYESLVAPNDASQFKAERDEIKRMKGETQKEGSLGNYGKLLDSTFMVKERQAYMASKGLVAIAAVAGTFHSLSQRIDNGLVVNAPISARFPHNTLNGKISFSGINSAGSKNPISFIIAQTVDGGVDVAKDKFLAEMGINSETAKNFLTITRAGASEKWAVRFINQPAIQDYVRLKAIHDSVSQVNPSVVRMPQWKLLSKIYAKYGGMDRNKERLNKDRPKQYTIAQMEHAITKVGEGGILTREEQTLQLQMLDDYLTWDSLGWDMFHYYQGFNWDTARLGDPNAIRLKQLKLLKADNLSISSANDMLKSTFIGPMYEAVEKLDTGLRSAINVQRGAANEILNRVTSDLFVQKGLSEQIRRSLLSQIELSMVDFGIQTNAEVDGKPINSYIQSLLLGEKSVARYVKAMQQSNIKRLADNPFLSNLNVNIDNRQGYPSTVSLQQRDYDTYTSNVWTDSFRELMDDTAVISINQNPEDDKTVAQIAKDLALVAILENGSKRGSNSISHLIPNESYGAFTRDTLRNLHLEGFYENNVHYRTNWSNNYLVPHVEMEKLDPRDPESPYIYPFLRTPGVLEAIKEDIGDQNMPQILNLPAWKYSSNKAVKIVEYKRDPRTKQVIDTNVKLFVRVDVNGIIRPEPLQVSKKRIIFKQINAWGDANNVQEYYEDARPSILPNNIKVAEVEDNTLIRYLVTGGLKPNIDLDSYNKSEDDNDDEGDVDDAGSVEPGPETPPPTQPTIPAGVPDRGKTYLDQQVVNKIKAGDVTLDSKVGSMEDGVYTTSDGTKLEFRNMGNAVVQGDNLAFTDGKLMPLDDYAKGSGFESWEDYKKNSKFSDNFIAGKQRRNIMEVSVFGSPKSASDIGTEENKIKETNELSSQDEPETDLGECKSGGKFSVKNKNK